MKKNQKNDQKLMCVSKFSTTEAKSKIIYPSLLRDCGIDYSIRGTYLFKLGETFMAGKKVVTR